MNENHERRAARRHELAMLFARASAAGYQPPAPRILSEAALRAATVSRPAPGPGARALARDYPPPGAM